MWEYDIQKGILSNGARYFKCYSGNAGPTQNNPDCCGLVGRGPLPPGRYDIGPLHDDPHLGPCVMRLTAQAGQDTKGRSGFFIHGDDIAHPGHGSDGCICTSGHTGRADRTYIGNSGDKVLEVTR